MEKQVHYFRFPLVIFRGNHMHHQARPENKVDPALILSGKRWGAFRAAEPAVPRLAIRILWLQAFILAWLGIWRPRAVRTIR